MCQAGSWKDEPETLGNVFGRLGVQEVKSFEGWEEVGEVISIGVGTQNYT